MDFKDVIRLFDRRYKKPNIIIRKMLLVTALCMSSFFVCGQEYLPKSKGEIIEHSYYTLAYSEEHEQALWVYYPLMDYMIGKKIKRSNDFREDYKVSTGSSTLADYKGSGYDRGHLAPAGDMTFSNIAMSESFFMSNMSPQSPSFNRGGWKKLESTVRYWAETDKIIYVATGAVLNDLLGRIGVNNVTVPSYYYKVIYSPKKEEMIAFIMPNTKIANPLPAYAVTVDEVETLTDIDFFPQLADSIEHKLESRVDISKWEFKEHKSSNSNKVPTEQCKGIATSTGKRCKHYTSNESGYCHQHEAQDGNPIPQQATVQCKGIATSTGKRCKNYTSNENGYCHLHKSQYGKSTPTTTTNYSSSRCAATTSSGTRCKRTAASGSRYCWQHK